ncbi:hypothetical protein [Pengzhenrongella sp.]|uniref:hypothetical protein n=1 Tax=Pengzhenrongella sp. TaxID=2888820 RepID=UPI002F95779B
MNADGAVRAPAARWAHVAAWPWWAQVLAVYAIARTFSALVLVVVAHTQAANGWTPAAPTYLQFTGLMWDGSWYRQIAESGYPAQLPIGADGVVQQNAWAFYPLFPLLVRVLMRVTGAPWQAAAPLLNLALGAAAMLVIYRVVELGAARLPASWESLSRRTARGDNNSQFAASGPGAGAAGGGAALALSTVVLVAFFPTAVVLQVAYSESLALLLIASALLALVRRRYLYAALVVIALGFTRAVALPMAVVVVVHALVRWRAARRGGEALGGRDVAALAGLVVVAVASGFAWQLVCAAVTGVPDGYLRTQAAWRGRPDVVPLVPWLDIARWLFQGWGPLVLGLVIAGFVALLTCPPARRLGPELRAWPAAYLVYLLGVVEPGTSLARFLLLAFPLGAVTAGIVQGPRVRRRAWLVAVVVVLALLQVGWVWALWRLTPPSGWPP